MRIRSFRKMIYEKHFNKEYLELEQKKKELETRIDNLLEIASLGGESAKVVHNKIEKLQFLDFC